MDFILLQVIRVFLADIGRNGTTYVSGAVKSIDAKVARGIEC